MAVQHRYSHHVRRALQHAESMALDYGHAHLDTAHLLVGVMKSEGSIGEKVMRDFDVPIPVAEVYLKRLMEAFVGVPQPIPLHPAFEKALEQAEDEANSLDSDSIGTEHLLLGVTRTYLGNAINLLYLLDITPEQLRRRTRHLISDGNFEFSLETLRANVRLSELSRRVLNAAELLAISHDHPTIGMGHLLLALSNERRGVTSGYLQQSGFQPDALKNALEQRQRTLFTGINAVVDEAVSQAEKVGSHYVGADHLLLAFSELDEGKSVLTRFGTAPDKINRLLNKHLK